MPVRTTKPSFMYGHNYSSHDIKEYDAAGFCCLPACKKFADARLRLGLVLGAPFAWHDLYPSNRHDLHGHFAGCDKSERHAYLSYPGLVLTYTTMISCLYGGYTLRSPIEAPLITREVLPETYFLLVIYYI